MTYAMAQPYATRVTWHQARKAFADGAEVLVSERGQHPELLVFPDTTTWTRDRISWDELAGQVRMWRNRYPSQRFYIVTRPGE